MESPDVEQRTRTQSGLIIPTDEEEPRRWHKAKVVYSSGLSLYVLLGKISIIELDPKLFQQEKYHSRNLSRGLVFIVQLLSEAYGAK